MVRAEGGGRGGGHQGRGGRATRGVGWGTGRAAGRVTLKRRWLKSVWSSPFHPQGQQVCSWPGHDREKDRGKQAAGVPSLR